MTSEELVESLKEMGILTHFNETMKLWQVMINDSVYYLNERQVDDMTNEELDAFVYAKFIYELKEKSVYGVTRH